MIRMSETNKKKGKIRIILGLLIVLIVLIVILVVIGFLIRNSMESKVKNTKIQNIFIGDALDLYCDETSWEAFSLKKISVNGENVLSEVRFKGTQKYDKGGNIIIDFIIDKGEVWIDGMWGSEREINDEESALKHQFNNVEMLDFLTKALKKHADDEGIAFNEKESKEIILNMIYYTDFERKLPEQKICGIRLQDFLEEINEGQLQILYGDISVTYDLKLSVAGLANKAEKFDDFNDTRLTIRFFDPKFAPEFFESSDESFYVITKMEKESDGESEELTQEDAVELLSNLVSLYCTSNGIQYDEDECTNELKTYIDINNEEK